MLLMFEKGLRSGISQAVFKYIKVNNKYMKNYDKNVKSSYLQYLDANNLYGWECVENYLLEDLNGRIVINILKV